VLAGNNSHINWNNPRTSSSFGDYQVEMQGMGLLDSGITARWRRCLQALERGYSSPENP
jgi:hypothetical protein